MLRGAVGEQRQWGNDAADSICQRDATQRDNSGVRFAGCGDHRSGRGGHARTRRRHDVHYPGAPGRDIYDQSTSHA